MNNSFQRVAFQNFLNEDQIYSPEDIENVMKRVRKYFKFSYTNTPTKYYNVPVSLDIETTSFRSTGNDEKCAVMYVWTFGIFGCIIMGRTWEEYENMINQLCQTLDLHDNKRLICYVHNLSFEFGFIGKRFAWKKVFAIDNYKPIYAIGENGIEYRCSYLLSGYNLENLAKNLQDNTIQKLVGDLDYSLMRHSKTPLTEQEKAYCVNDVKIVMEYIAECIIDEKGISKIPLTKTGYVRRYCRNRCFYDKTKDKHNDYTRLRYSRLMKRLRLTAPEYEQLKRAFMGGFTHANPFASGKVFHDVTSFDFTSSYPFVLLSEQFPMSSSEHIPNISKEEFYKSLKLYCCLFDIEFINISPKIHYENYISVSRCYVKEKYTDNNGRLVRADRIITTITDVDFMIIKKFYKWEKMRVSNFRRYQKDYLPTDFVKSILKLYQDKTELKDVDGKEIEYQKVKEMLNSCYGMCVTDIAREEFIFNGEKWLDREEKPEKDNESLIIKYNRNPGRFLFYPWGVWVTAYARRNLFTGILEFKGDYLYSDTDSIKVRNAKQHQNYIEHYNQIAQETLIKAMKYHKINPEETMPKTKDGVIKPLGVWDFDGHYESFKTLGAKRYMVTYSYDKRNKKKNMGKTTITVAGLNKQKAVPYLQNIVERTGNITIYDLFNDDMYIPAEYTGKNVHTYINEIREGYLTDYTGLTEHYKELSGIHLAQADYSLKLAQTYRDYLLDIESDDW